MGRAGKGRLDDGSVGLLVEGRGDGWDEMGDGAVVKETQGVEYREVCLMDEMIKCRKHKILLIETGGPACFLGKIWI